MKQTSALDIRGVPWPHAVIDEDVEELVGCLSISIKDTGYVPWESIREFKNNQVVKKPLKVMQEPDDIGLDASCDNKDCKDYSQELFSFDSKQPSSPSPEDAYDDTLTNIQFTEISISTANLINDSGESRQSSTVGPSPSDISGFNLLPSSHASDMTPLIRQKSLENIKRTDGAVSWAYNGTDMEGHGAFGTEWLLAGDTKERCLGWTTGLKVTDNGFLYVPRLMEPQPVRGPELRPSWVDIWKGH